MNVNEFLETLKSPKTQRAYKRAINQFLAFHKLEEEDALKLTLDGAEEALEAFKDHLEKKGRAGQTIHIYWYGVKKWFIKNKIKITAKCEGLDKSKTIFDYIPNKRDVKLLYGNARLDYKVAVCLQAFSGMRPVDVRHLKYQHIRESYERGDDVLTIEMKDKKRKNWFVTFLGPEGLFNLRELIEKRRNGYTETITINKKKVTAVVPPEIITNETFIMKWSKDQDKTVEPRTEKAYGKYMRELIEGTVGFHPTNTPFKRFRSYGLRKYFRKWAARVYDRDEAEFLMAHKSGSRNLARTYSGIDDHDPEVINDLKAKYTEHLPDLETEMLNVTIKTEMEQVREELEEYKRMNQKLNDEVAELKAHQQPGASQDEVDALKGQFKNMLELLKNPNKQAEDELAQLYQQIEAEEE